MIEYEFGRIYLDGNALTLEEAERLAIDLLTKVMEIRYDSVRHTT